METIADYLESIRASLKEIEELTSTATDPREVSPQFAESLRNINHEAVSTVEWVRFVVSFK